eukprot:gene21764-24516_t
MAKGKKKTWSGVYWGSVVAVPGENPNEGIPKLAGVYRDTTCTPLQHLDSQQPTCPVAKMQYDRRALSEGKDDKIKFELNESEITVTDAQKN